MARLDKLREAIYQRKFEEPTRPPEDDLPLGLPDRGKPLPLSWGKNGNGTPALAADISSASKKRRRRRIAVAAFIISTLLLAGGAYLGYTLFLLASDVSFSLAGPGEVIAGEPAVFKIAVVNRGRVLLQNPSVTLNFSVGTITDENPRIGLNPPRMKVMLDDIPAGGRAEKEVRVRILGVEGQSHTVTGLLVYQPENIASQLTRQADVTVRIARVPIAINMEVPERLSSGQDVTLSVGVDSELTLPLADMSLGIEFPSGFDFKSADPKPLAGDDYIWPLRDLETGRSEKITLRGKISGEPEEAKTFRLRLGSYEPSSKRWVLVAESQTSPIISSPFLLAQATLNGARSGSIAPGAQVKGTIYFRNNLPAKVQNVTITFSFPEQLVDLRSIRAERGFYDVPKKAITWTPTSESRMKEIPSGGDGTLGFSFTMKSSLPISVFSDKNFTFPVTATIDSASPPAEYQGVSLRSQDTTQYKIASTLGVLARSAYYDSPFPNQGPLPPKVRAKTTYTLYLQVTSGANDIRDVEVRAALPGGVAWENRVATDLGVVTFNPATEEISWKIRDLPAATGILRAPLAAVIQVGLIPAENQTGSAPKLLQGISATGRDVFTDFNLSATADDITTDLRTDIRSVGAEWKVVP
ncbi:MAG: hypothetical protein A3A44_01100 [Candidatus Sungbacteria bacterium RIFCSPLOWO2_01_FULL_60_25]|uniref:DUF11 domain-containing protein n=1 Tax=Candidatus Sungbacteria bacterium RIFCSPLOWO2_01_FULL_60_25 TaxID=1802281 RepID=A0A1G2LDW3_9BACT|nr:MAG: hypothetical protein A3A44_01100 [Candidatus Sungbacteria bacterium RIFCSPLOWO2_01_FULL_60_25]